MNTKVMKNTVLFFALISFAVTLSAADLTGKRIYVNPGHGSYGANDRPMATIPYPNLPKSGKPDTCGFYETNTNLWKCLYLGKKLEEAGAYVMYSRTTSGPWDYPKVDGDYPTYSWSAYESRSDYRKYNKDLSVICEEVEANNFDYFISVHSNAATEGSVTNYPVYLYRGPDAYKTADKTNGFEYVEGSVEACAASWPYRMEIMTTGLDPHNAYSDTKTNIRGDVDFMHGYSTATRSNGKRYKGYYGVLKHGAIGFLVEGYFHTYQPARHRALNPHYCYMEGLAYYRGILDYFNADKEETGYVLGTIKDQYTKIDHPLFSYKAKTNDQWLPCNGATVILKKGGKEVASYKVDNNYNGIFMFEDLVPGDDYSLEATCDGYYPLEEQYKAPFSVKANATTYSMIYMVDTTFISASISPLTPDFPNQAENATLADNVVLEEYPIVPTPFLDGMNIRRMLTRGTKTYVLNDKSEIYVVNTYTGQQISKLSTKGIDMTATLPISDIAFTSDTVLLACNKVSVAKDNPTTQMNVYKWDSDNADPTIMYSLQHAAGYTSAELGETMTVTGNIWWHRLFVSAVSEDSKRYVTIFGLEYMKDKGIRQTKYMASRNTYTEAKWGSDFYFQIVPTYDHSYFVVDGANMELSEYMFDWTVSDRSSLVKLNAIEENEIPAASQGASYFQYAGTYYSIIPTCDANGLNYGMQLYEMIESKAGKLLVSINTPRSGKMPQVGLNTAAVNFVHTAAVVEGDDLNMVMYLPKVGIARYSTRQYNHLETIDTESINWNYPVYDLLGRQVDKNYKGIIIQQGKKYILVNQ